MPNIMLTYRCNLNCSYCFANEFVNKDRTDISLEYFDKAVRFFTASGPTHLGLIGGEPTLHPNFKLILEKLIDNALVSSVTIYTNGILLDKYINQISHPKFRILVNCNSPKNIGQNKYDLMQKNLDLLFFEHYMKDRVNLGINLYSDRIDYKYIFNLLKRYDLHRVRISTTVPNFAEESDINVLEYFKNKKPFLLKLFKDLDSIQVLPYYDCNKPPYCIWSEDEKIWLENFVSKYGVKESDLIGHCSKCFPVIDILPNLKAVRCFGMSDFCKVDISEFNDFTELASYFLNVVDADAYKISAGSECRECKQSQIRKCMSGCLGFKSSQIKKCNEFCMQL